jgi:nicotinate-nucleotide adenylyltransferase
LKTIGLYGGTFDPVHVGHVALARTARDALALDEVRWIPVGVPWQKGGAHATPHQRAEMVAIAIDGEPRFVLDRIEVDRAGPSYTLETVRALQDGTPPARWMLLLGADQHAGLHTWQGWPELLDRVTLAIAARPGERPPVDTAVAARGHVDVPMAPSEVSSREIRARLSAGLPIDGMVPPGVARYIARHSLYSRS